MALRGHTGIHGVQGFGIGAGGGFGFGAFVGSLTKLMLPSETMSP